MKPRFRRHLKLRERKMAKAWGVICLKTGRIDIDPRATPRKRLETIMHEALHEVCPHWTEKQMRTITRALRDALWSDGYRRIYQ